MWDAPFSAIATIIRAFFSLWNIHASPDFGCEIFVPLNFIYYRLRVKNSDDFCGQILLDVDWYWTITGSQVLVSINIRYLLNIYAFREGLLILFPEESLRNAFPIQLILLFLHDHVCFINNSASVTQATSSIKYFWKEKSRTCWKKRQEAQANLRSDFILFLKWK